MTTATDGSGVEAMWEAVAAHRTHIEATGALERRRIARFRYEVASRLATRMERSIARSVDGLTPDGRPPPRLPPTWQPTSSPERPGSS